MLQGSRTLPAWPPGAWALGWALPAALGSVLLLLLRPQWGQALAPAIVAAVLLPAAALALVARAGQRGGWALAALAFAAVLLSDLSLRAQEGGGVDAQSAAKFAAWTLPLLLVLWRWRALALGLREAPTGLLLLFGLWCLMGAATSVTPAYTAAAALSFLGLWVAGTLCARALPLQQGLVAVAAALAVLAAASLLMGWLAPERAWFAMDNGRHLRLEGVFGSPNNLGRAAALLALVALLLAPQLRRRRALVLLLLALPLAAACLVLSGSRTSVLALAAALGVALLGRRPGLALLLGALALAAGLAVAALPPLQAGLVGLLSRSGDLGELTSFTGRTDIWTAVLRLIDERPLLGHGFASSRQVIPAGFQAEFGWTTTSAHNLWLQAWLTTGAVGLAIVLAAQLAWAGQALARPLASRDALVAYVLVVGAFEAGALGPSVNLLTFVWCWALGLGAADPREPSGG